MTDFSFRREARFAFTSYLKKKYVRLHRTYFSLLIMAMLGTFIQDNIAPRTRRHSATFKVSSTRLIGQILFRKMTINTVREAQAKSVGKMYGLLMLRCYITICSKLLTYLNDLLDFRPAGLIKSKISTADCKCSCFSRVRRSKKNRKRDLWEKCHEYMTPFSLVED